MVSGKSRFTEAREVEGLGLLMVELICPFGGAMKPDYTCDIIVAYRPSFSKCLYVSLEIKGTTYQVVLYMFQALSIGTSYVI